MNLGIGTVRAQIDILLVLSKAEGLAFPFVVKIKLPPPRIAREIVERNGQGRIVHSIVPIK